MFTYTTPTFTMSLPEGIDLGSADNVYVTFATNGKHILTKSNGDLFIRKNVIRVTLTQSETKNFPHRVNLQVNWTYTEDGMQKRACSNVKSLEFRNNLVEEELV